MQHKQRASKNLHKHDFIFKYTEKILSKRIIEDFHFQKFNNALIYGQFETNLPNIENITHAAFYTNDKSYLVYDEELLPEFNKKFDLIVSHLSLHSVNDLPGALIQYRNILNSNGVFIATIFGSQTLQELRQALLAADIKLHNSAAARIIPFTDVKDAARLLSRAGFKNPVADTYNLIIKYKDLKSLLLDIKGMGENNYLLRRPQHFPRKNFFTQVAAEYPLDLSNQLSATVEIITVVGWK
jgi:SAM-dependent methyltransferase